METESIKQRKIKLNDELDTILAECRILFSQPPTATYEHRCNQLKNRYIQIHTELEQLNHQ